MLDLYEVGSNQGGTPSPSCFAVHVHAALARARLVDNPGYPFLQSLLAGRAEEVGGGQVEEGHLDILFKRAKRF